MNIDISKFKNIPFKKRRHCVVCGQKLGSPVIELPDFPITEIYVKKKINKKVGFVDQNFHFCKNCGHGQISNIIDSEFLYGRWYVTRTSISSSAVAAINVFLEFIDNILKGRPVKNIVEIGCNDLYTLKKLRKRADKLYGIDPILIGKEKQFRDEKIEIIGDFFENVDLKKINGKIDVVLSSHTLEHIGEPKELIQRVIANANSNTLFFFQFPSLEALVQSSRFDQVFHQHLNYFSLKSVVYMLNELGAELIDFKINPYHWGTLMIAFKKKNKNNVVPHDKIANFLIHISNEKILKHYSIFKDCMNITKRQLESLKDEKIYGYGAALMLPVLDYHLGGLKMIKCVIDDDKNKDGLYYLNLPIQIKHLDRISDFKNSVFLVTAINSLQTARAIIKRLIEIETKQIIIPLNLI